MSPSELDSIRAEIGALRGSVERSIDGLRDDVREDNQRTEARLMNALTAFARAHGQEHEELDAEREREHGAFSDFIRNAQLTQARKDGALGIFRFMLELLSKHARPIVAILIAIASAVGVFLGRISISVGT